ncbi:hypothetical protein DL96DRAFT_324487 [Flagelloscypha sp. PMI_526]|nr:hypothetical protein DL96DRAFT_324487 [Flagelloscypha sp. PMI_526]
MLNGLPVELLYEIQLFSTSSELPLVSSRLYQIFRAAPPVYAATFLSEKISKDHGAHQLDAARVLTYALRYPICSDTVFDVLCQLPPVSNSSPGAILRPELPRRLFRTLSPKKTWKSRHRPLPFLRHLYKDPHILPDTNAYDGYALVKATVSGFTDLVEFLLDNGASPKMKDNLAALVAIRAKNLQMLKLLVEPKRDPLRRGKRKKMDDRMELTPAMAHAAAKSGANDILNWMVQEKGCKLEMRTLLI